MLQQPGKVLVLGAGGMVGSAISRALTAREVDHVKVTRKDAELTDACEVQELFQRFAPASVYLAAARVGGIIANSTQPAEFIRDNLLIQANVIEAAHRYGCQKLLFLGSSCIYPRDCPQPIREEYLMSGPLEPTNSAYAIAKIAGIEMLKAYRKQYAFCGISLMPTNLYGPGDNYDLQNSHVIPGMLRRFHEAMEAEIGAVTIWGSGRPRREFMHVDDLAEAALHCMDCYDSPEPINIGTGEDISIAALACMIRTTVGYCGDILWDDSKPDGTPRKLLDVSRIKALGWKPKISLREGVAATYAEYRSGTHQRG